MLLNVMPPRTLSPVMTASRSAADSSPVKLISLLIVHQDSGRRQCLTGASPPQSNNFFADPTYGTFICFRSAGRI